MSDTSSNDPTRQDLKHTAKSAVDSTTREVRSMASEATEKVTKDVRRQADSAKANLASEFSDTAGALRTAAREMRSGSAQERTVGQIAESLADVSDAIQGKDLNELVKGASDFARRNPLAFIGGAALLGFAASRFLKATGETGHVSSDPYAPAHPASPIPPASTEASHMASARGPLSGPDTTGANR